MTCGSDQCHISMTEKSVCFAPQPNQIIRLSFLCPFTFSFSMTLKTHFSYFGIKNRTMSSYSGRSNLSEKFPISLFDKLFCILFFYLDKMLKSALVYKQREKKKDEQTCVWSQQKEKRKEPDSYSGDRKHYSYI